jgi:hypothetical protein
VVPRSGTGNHDIWLGFVVLSRTVDNLLPKESCTCANKGLDALQAIAATLVQ